MIDTEIQGDPASVESAATWLRQSLASGVDSWADALVAARRTAVADWGGEAGPAFGAQMRRGVTATDALVADVKAAANTSDAFAARLRRAQDRMTEIRARASRAGLTVHGFAIENPGSGPPHPGTPPVDASPVAVEHYNQSVLAWNDHQHLVIAYNTADAEARETIDDFEQACTLAEDEYQGLNSVQQVLAGADIAGAAVMGAVGAKHTSILSKHAEYLDGEVAKWRTRIANGNYNHALGRAALIRDQDILFDEQTRAARAANDLERAQGRPKLSAAGKVLSGGLGAAGAGVGIYYDLQAGESATQAVTSNVGGVAVGAASGAAAGAVVGSFVPVAGTAVGAVVGAGVGLIASGAIDSLFENGPDVGRAFDEGLEAFTDTASAIGDAGGAVVDTVGGWFD